MVTPLTLLLLSLQSIGRIGEDGAWQLKDLGPQWPEDLPGPYRDPRD